MGKKKIIFVDDEPSILDGLRRTLRSLRNEFDMYFTISGSEALKVMAAEHIDVVISDMRMPGMDGAELLERIQKDYPHAIRIMLTGQADEVSILRTVGVVHQFLAKPCDPERLKAILIQTAALQDMLSDGGLKNLISQLGKMPSLPSLYAKLQKIIAKPNVAISEVADIIAQDIGMTVKVLHLVNSSFFGIYSRVDTAERAVTLLGLDTIKALILSLELFSAIKVSEEVFQVDTLYSHSLMVGKIAKAIAAQQSKDEVLISNTFLAGTLHDLGKLDLLSSLPDKYRQVIRLAQEQNIPMTEAELSVFGVSQSVVGAYLLGLWGFNGPIIEGICFFNQLEKYPANSFNPALAVHVANCLYYRNRPNEITGKATELDMPVLERLGLQGECAGWEKICSKIMQA